GLHRLRVEARRAVRAEVNVDAPLLEDRRRRRVAVELLPQRVGLRDDEQLVVGEDLAAVTVDADHRQLLAVARAGGEPDLLPPDDGRRPAAAVDRGLPD